VAIDPERVKTLFLAAIERGDPDERRAFLDAEVGDADLRDRLDALLAAYDQPPSALDRPLAADPEATDTPDATRSVSSPPAGGIGDDGTTVDQPKNDGPNLIDTIIADRYKIRQEIGEGGMGTVYLAEQLRPARRLVALKLIKPGMDSRNVLARFESERQALALMEHPHIARVLDAGTTADGRPFFVMELVKGIPITQYCDAHRLDVPARLELFREVCSVVQHAHQKGIIHRDLKPSNILVESHDGRPVPKVIDFGLAKATSGMRLTEQSLFTAFGTVAGTPLYMAPEQASFNALDIDTRADIYALGAILYELLTGTTPIARKSIQRAALDEMLRVIREVEPPAPSSRISTSEALPSLAANRQVEPARLSRLVRGDLDWIVMKALAKERERRYASAVGLADDLERFLNHEPVSAGPPTTAYRLRKFVRRNRARVAAAGLVLLALVLGVVGTTHGLFEARRQKRQAEKGLAQVMKMNEILGSIFKDLDPRSIQKDGEQLRVVLGKRLDRAMEGIEGEATGDPLAVAWLQMTLGSSQLGLGYPDRAIELFTRARAIYSGTLGADHPETLRSMGSLAASFHKAGHIDQALELHEKTLALQKARLGPEHHDTLVTMNNLAITCFDAGQTDRALKLHEETLTLQKVKLGPQHPETLATMSNLANAYQVAGQSDRALKLREETLDVMRAKLGPNHPHTLGAMGNLATSYQDAGLQDRALKLNGESLALLRAKLGPDHPETLATMDNAAIIYRNAGQPNQAMIFNEEALVQQKAKLGPDHPQTLTSMQNLAKSYSSAGRFDRALKLNEEVLAIRRVKLGPDHPNTLSSMSNLAVSYNQTGQHERARKIREETLPLMRVKLGLDHPETMMTMQHLAMSYRIAGQIDRALKLDEETLALRRAKQGPFHPDTLLSASILANDYRDAGQHVRAMQLYEEVLALMKAKLSPMHPYTLLSLNQRAACLANSGQLDRAEAILDEVIASRRKSLGDCHPETVRVRISRAELDLIHGRLEGAEAADRTILEECRTRFGPDSQITITAGIALARVRQARGDHDSAATLLRAALESARKNPTDRDTLATALAESGRSRFAAGDWGTAEAQIREALTILEVEKPQHWQTAEVRSLLGGALMGQRKAAEAAPLLRAGYEGMARSAAAIPRVDRPRLAEALDRLIAAGEAAGTKAELAAWKAERAKLGAGGPKP
jgi:serine/threonine protein kinase/lipopolysaccharide biosynthesis regulator YciM